MREDPFKEVKFLSERHWLNPLEHYDTGALTSYVTADAWSAYAGLQIRDCSRQIELDFGCTTVEELAQRMEKITLMIDVLSTMRSALPIAHAEHQKLKAAEAAMRKAKEAEDGTS